MLASHSSSGGTSASCSNWAAVRPDCIGWNEVGHGAPCSYILNMIMYFIVLKSNLKCRNLCRALQWWIVTSAAIASTGVAALALDRSALIHPLQPKTRPGFGRDHLSPRASRNEFQPRSRQYESAPIYCPPDARAALQCGPSGVYKHPAHQQQPRPMNNHAAHPAADHCQMTNDPIKPTY